MPGTLESICHVGLAHDIEIPPPPAPHSAPSFQTCSEGGWVGVVDRRAADGHDVGLAGRVEHGERVLAGGRLDLAELVAVVAAVVTCCGEDRLPLRGRLLEQQVLGLLETRLGELNRLLAQTPARRHDLGRCRC